MLTFDENIIPIFSWVANIDEIKYYFYLVMTKEKSDYLISLIQAGQTVIYDYGSGRAIIMTGFKDNPFYVISYDVYLPDYFVMKKRTLDIYTTDYRTIPKATISGWNWIGTGDELKLYLSLNKWDHWMDLVDKGHQVVIDYNNGAYYVFRKELKTGYIINEYLYDIDYMLTHGVYDKDIKIYYSLDELKQAYMRNSGKNVFVNSLNNVKKV